MSTLDSPQHIFVCRVCGAREAGAIFCPHGPEDVNVEPTLTYADFEAWFAVEAVAGLRRAQPLPDPLDVWARLESHVDGCGTNGEAIGHAVIYCTNRDRSKARDGL